MAGKKGRLPTSAEMLLWADVTDRLDWRRHDPRDHQGQSTDIQGVGPHVKKGPLNKIAGMPRMKSSDPSAEGRALKPLVMSEHAFGHKRARRQMMRRSAFPLVLDLHHKTQAEARASLRDFLLKAQANGEPVALVITGKGRSKEGDSLNTRPVGILQRMVPLWLGEPEWRPFVVGFTTAHPHHGGSGALYVKIRRKGKK